MKTASHWPRACAACEPFRSVVSNLGPPDVLGLPLPEAFTTTTTLAGQDFWELKSKNIWRPKVGDHWPTAFSIAGSTAIYSPPDIVGLQPPTALASAGNDE